jgi:hypothetical protein
MVPRGTIYGTICSNFHYHHVSRGTFGTFIYPPFSPPAKSPDYILRKIRVLLPPGRNKSKSVSSAPVCRQEVSSYGMFHVELLEHKFIILIHLPLNHPITYYGKSAYFCHQAETNINPRHPCSCCGMFHVELLKHIYIILFHLPVIHPITYYRKSAYFCHQAETKLNPRHQRSSCGMFHVEL